MGDVAPDRVRDYIEENDYDRDEEISNYLIDHLDLDSEQAQAVIDSSDDREGNPEAYALYAEAVDYAQKQLEELVEQALDEFNNSYDNAREEWEEENIEDSDWDEGTWLRDIGVRYMSDVPGEFSSRRVSISWPHYTYPETSSEGGFNESAATDLARDLASTLDVNARAGSGYHSLSRRPGLWIIESDSSLEADDDDDMPAEIVSPPMPLEECLAKMKQFFEWAEGHSAYSNHSTGLHIGVSLPVVGGKVDYLKLALFLGDQYVLDTFNRSSNYFARSAIEKINKQVRDEKQSNIPDTLKVLQHGLTEFAQKTLKTNTSFGKYTSINPKGDYIEFRSMGDDYYEKVPQILNTVKRFAYAMHIASRPDLYKQEYSKKLYKMLAANSDTKDKNTIDLFVKYSTGDLDKQSLINYVQLVQSQRAKTDTKTDTKTDNMKWAIINTGTGFAASNFLAPSKAHAVQKFHDWLARTANTPSGYKLEKLEDEEGEEQEQSSNDTQQRFEIFRRSSGEALRHGGPGSEVLAFLANSQDDAESKLERYCRDYALGAPQLFGVRPSGGERAPQPGSTTDLQQQRSQGGFTGEWKVIDNTGRELYRFGGVGNSQADANRIAQQWVNTQRERGHQIDAREIDVLPVMGNQ